MAQLSFGTILHNERERKGYDLATVARRLRIRPDILQSIEDSDFSRMPPRGYARNMVNAYARYLGLNPTEITRMYLDEVYSEQVKKARTHAQPSGFDMSNTAGNRRIYSRKNPVDNDNARYDNESGRMVYVDSNTSRYRTEETDRVHLNDRTHRSTRSSLPGAQYTNFYAGPKVGGAVASRVPFIIGGVVLLVIIIIVLFFVFSQKDSVDDDVQKVPVTGVDDTTSLDYSEVVTETPVEVAPTKAVFSYEILDGQSAYIEIYENESITDLGTMTGPINETYDVTGTLRLDTTNPSAVKVFQDGTEVVLSDDDGDGVYSITIDYPAILEQWQTEHPGTGTRSNANATNSDAVDTETDTVNPDTNTSTNTNNSAA